MLRLFGSDYPKHMRDFLLRLQLLHSAHADDILASVLPDALRHGTPQGLADALAAVSADTRFRLPEIRCPALLVYGGRRRAVTPRMGHIWRGICPTHGWCCRRRAYPVSEPCGRNCRTAGCVCRKTGAA